MRAVVYDSFRSEPSVREVPDPQPPEGGVVVRVEATGLCRSDWHGWMGHDPDIVLPHVPGHELAGVVTGVGEDVRSWSPGDRVTVPFVCGCGDCPECDSGNPQVCDRQIQPGFTHWGSFAGLVEIHRAEYNLVALPDSISFRGAASLGCRFVTAFRAVVDQGRVAPGEQVVVHGCGGVGLSAIQIARAKGARVTAVDIDENRLDLAMSLGAEASVNVGRVEDVVKEVMWMTDGGAHLSLDALGSPDTCFHSVAGLRKRGRHVQVGLLVSGESRPALPMDLVVGRELEIRGSHGVQASRYPAILDLIRESEIDPERMIGAVIDLDAAPGALTAMDSFSGTGITVIEPGS